MPALERRPFKVNSDVPVTPASDPYRPALRVPETHPPVSNKSASWTRADLLFMPLQLRPATAAAT